MLEDDHILSRHRANPEEIEDGQKGTGRLDHRYVVKCEDGCSSTREIERTLGYLFGPAGQEVVDGHQKLLVKDPRVAVPNKKTEPYGLCDEPVKPEQEVLRDFFDEKVEIENRFGGKAF